jgi:hypothetical protein
MLIPIILASGFVAWVWSESARTEALKEATVVSGCAPCEAATVVGATPYRQQVPWYSPQKLTMTAGGCINFTPARYGSEACHKCGVAHVPAATSSSSSCGCGCASGFGYECNCDGGTRTVIPRAPTSPKPESPEPVASSVPAEGTPLLYDEPLYDTPMPRTSVEFSEPESPTTRTSIEFYEEPVTESRLVLSRKETAYYNEPVKETAFNEYSGEYLYKQNAPESSYTFNPITASAPVRG